MIDRILSKFFEFIDNQIQKIEDVLTFDVGQELKKKRKKKNEDCNSICTIDVHTSRFRKSNGVYDN
mgnify:CR=1 FL=1